MDMYFFYFLLRVHGSGYFVLGSNFQNEDFNKWLHFEFFLLSSMFLRRKY